MSDLYEGPLYESFGVRKHVTHRKVDTGQEVEIPRDELFDGLKDVEIKLYGDAPEQPFVRIVATTQMRAQVVFRQTMETLTPELIEKMVH